MAIIKDGIKTFEGEVTLTLDRKFKHKNLFRGSNLTVREFLELAAESHGFWLGVKKEFKSDNLLDDECEVYNILMCEEGKDTIKLTNEEADYFNKRRRFWRMWQEDFSSKYFSGIYDRAYIELQNTKKREIPEYLQAICKISNSKNSSK